MSPDEHRQIPIRQILVVRQLLHLPDVELGQFLTDVARPRVQHHPDHALIIGADLQEMVTPAAADLARLVVLAGSPRPSNLQASQTRDPFPG
jgi:hypothetical protein